MWAKAKTRIAAQPSEAHKTKHIKYTNHTRVRQGKLNEIKAKGREGKTEQTKANKQNCHGKASATGTVLPQEVGPPI